ncbi:aldo/keto reductase [Sphingomonas oryzagri]
MDRTTLAGRETSRIGFGCGRLVGGAGTPASIRLIEQARAIGISHFDVAPSYGLGLAENVLGKVLAGDRDVTIATKIGIGRPTNPGMKALARQILRPLLTATPALRQKLASKAQRGAARNQYEQAQVESSFAESLRRLQRDRIDALLLHQPEAGDLTSTLRAVMDRLVAEGRAGAIGSSTAADRDSVIPLGSVHQYRWSPSPLPPCDTGVTSIAHGLLRRYPRPRANDTISMARMAEAGFDPKDPTAWPGLLLSLALATTPGGLVLISSSDPERLRASVTAIDWVAASGKRAGFVEGAIELLHRVQTKEPSAASLPPIDRTQYIHPSNSTMAVSSRDSEEA